MSYPQFSYTMLCYTTNYMSQNKLNEKLASMGAGQIKDIQAHPERTDYLDYLLNGDKADENRATKLKYLANEYMQTFHKHVHTIYPYMLYEKTNDKTYWNYNDDTGVYDELSFPEVRSLIIKLLMNEGFIPKANESFAKSTLNKWRSAYPKAGKSYDEFDTQEGWFHAKNGWLELSTLNFTDHTPDKISRMVSAVAYDKEATCPLYDDFLDVQSQMPEDQVRVIKQYSGYVLTDSIEAEQMLIFEGRPGSGKSMIPEVWMKVLGKKAVSTTLGRVGGGSEFNGDELVDRTLCFIDEANPKTKDINESFQNLVTQQTIRVERKGIQDKSFVPNKLKLVMCLNEMPDHMPPGMHRRYRHILFTRSFSDEGIKDGRIRINIFENELSGVLNRMVEGLKDYKKMGLTVIENEESRKHEYDLGADDFSAFLDNHFVPVKDSDVRYTYDELRAAFVAEFPKRYNQGLSIQAFNKKLLSNRLSAFSKIGKGRNKMIRGYTGIKLRDGHSFSAYSHETIKIENSQDW